MNRITYINSCPKVLAARAVVEGIKKAHWDAAVAGLAAGWGSGTVRHQEDPAYLEAGYAFSAAYQRAGARFDRA